MWYVVTKKTYNLQGKIPFILSTSSPYLHNQNGKVEQGVKMFKDMARKVIFDPDKGLNKSDWNYYQSLQKL